MIANAAPSFAGGPFGPPQSVSNEAGGLNTALGYWYYSDKLKDGTHHIIQENQIYTQAGYGTRYWEIYGRLSAADLKIIDAFGSTQSTTSAAHTDFYDGWNFAGTMGVKGFYPYNTLAGIGAFVQGSYFFGDFKDQVSGTSGGTPFTSELDVKKPLGHQYRHKPAGLGPL